MIINICIFFGVSWSMLFVLSSIACLVACTFWVKEIKLLSMSYNNGYYHGHAEAGYPGHPPYGPPPYYHTPPPSYAAPTGYPPGPLPPPTYPGYSPRYPPSQNGPYYPPPMPYQSPGGGWPNQGPRHFNGHNNRGRQNFRQPFNGHQQNWNDNSGRKRKYDSYGSQIENVRNILLLHFWNLFFCFIIK